MVTMDKQWCTFNVLRLSTIYIMGIRPQNMPQTSNSLLSPTKFMVARGNHLCAPLPCTPPHTPPFTPLLYEWLGVPTTANHSLTHGLHAPYRCLTCTLHVLYEWLRVPHHSQSQPYICLTHALHHALRTLYTHLTHALCVLLWLVKGSQNSQSHLMHTLCMLYACLTYALRAPDMPLTCTLWLVKGTHHSQSQPYVRLMSALCTLYACLTCTLCLPYMHLTYTLWLVKGPTANHSLTCALRAPYSLLTWTLCMLYVPCKFMIF